jgi:hypothetical protein
VSPSAAPIDFATYQWIPGGATTKSIVVNPVSNTVYTLTVTDYKGTAQGPTITAPLPEQAILLPARCSFQMLTLAQLQRLIIVLD